jgi:23S rRNA (guanosine2251-2'-O)-methyltransferase
VSILSHVLTLEGVQSVLPAILARRRRIEVILVKHDTPRVRVQDVLDAAERFGVPVRFAEGSELSHLAHGATHGGVVAVVSALPRFDDRELFDLLKGVARPVLMLIEGIDDARNLGFLLRTAESVGVTAMLVKKHLWDLDETEIARSASGSLERMPLVQFDQLDLVRDLQKQALKLYACVAGARRSIFDIDLTEPTIMALGGEKRGLSGALRDVCDGFVTIPTLGGATSLSLSHAGAIVCGEVLRQRRLSSRASVS